MLGTIHAVVTERSRMTFGQVAIGPALNYKVRRIDWWVEVCGLIQDETAFDLMEGHGPKINGRDGGN